MNKLIALFLLVSASQARAATYYISPSGSDSNSGLSAAAPWKTFAVALAKVACGNTLLVLDGVYNGAGNIVVDIRNRACSAAAPLVIKAANERRAHLHNDGRAIGAVYISNSSYITLEGLEISSQDNNYLPGSTSETGSGLHIDTAHHLTFRRLLVHHNNRYGNTHLLVGIGLTDSLIEESEFQFYHRHAINTKPGERNVFRRIYCNGRRHGTIPDGYPNGSGWSSSDSCLSLYPAADTLVENSIAEESTTLMGAPASGEVAMKNIKILGSVSLNGWAGILFKARFECVPMSVRCQPVDSVVENTAIIGVNSSVAAFYHVGGVNTQVRNLTVMNTAQIGAVVASIDQSGAPAGNTFFADNILLVNNAGIGLRLDGALTDFAIRNSNVFGSSHSNFSPATSADYQGTRSVDPVMGACRVWIPDGSPMKRAGVNGADIGANILYRYQDGVLTNQPLWNPATGQFPCGALVAGINDTPGASCNDVHKRLNVNTNGCSFPAGYAATIPPLSAMAPAAPRNLRLR